MLDDWKRDRARKRVQPGDGSALPRFRWWQPTSRSLLHVDLGDGRYSLDVRHLKTDDDGYVRSFLYRDGRQVAQSRLPAAYPVPGGVIEAAASEYGLKRAHLVRDDGSERQLDPDPRSAEGWRATLHRTRPGLSRLIGAVSMTVLLVSLGLLLLQLAEQLTGVPAVHDVIGDFRSPVVLPVPVNVTLSVLAALASVERATRLRYSGWLD